MIVAKTAGPRVRSQFRAAFHPGHGSCSTWLMPAPPGRPSKPQRGRPYPHLECQPSGGRRRRCERADLPAAPGKSGILPGNSRGGESTRSPLPRRHPRRRAVDRYGLGKCGMHVPIRDAHATFAFLDDVSRVGPAGRLYRVGRIVVDDRSTRSHARDDGRDAHDRRVAEERDGRPRPRSAGHGVGRGLPGRECAVMQRSRGSSRCSRSTPAAHPCPGRSR